MSDRLGFRSGDSVDVVGGEFVGVSGDDGEFDGEEVGMRVFLAGFVLLSGCVSRKAYIAQGEALARSLELNRACIASVEALEKKNKAYEGIYGDSLRLRKEVEAGKLK